MKVLLTSSGFTNPTIIEAFRGMLDRPTSESRLVIIPTAQNPEDNNKEWVIDENYVGPRSLGWKHIQIVDIAAMSSLPEQYWLPHIEAADVLLFGGGNPYYLSHWLQASGLWDRLPQLLESKVYVGISAGSMVASVGLQADQDFFDEQGQPFGKSVDDLAPLGQGSDRTLGYIPQVYRPHFARTGTPNPKLRAETLQNLARAIGLPMYACDDDTALKVVDDKIEVVSEGQWRLLEP